MLVNKFYPFPIPRLKLDEPLQMSIPETDYEGNDLWSLAFPSVEEFFSQYRKWHKMIIGY